MGASLSDDKQHWVVHYEQDAAPGRFFYYDRAKKDARFLFTRRPALENVPLAPMEPVVVRARDGLELVCYLSRLITRHAVLSVNYRGSTGLGKAFVNAANLEWAGKMHDDLIDAVDWAIARGIADPKRVAIYGQSYGGYAALVGATFTPEKFACAVDLFGISNLVTFLNTIPDYWKSWQSVWKVRMGDYMTEAGRKQLEERSPLNHVDRIVRPLLIGQGANDVRVKAAESEQIVAALKQRGIPVTYVYYSDEGHGFRRPENRRSFTATVEAFLAQHLGGRFEPVGTDFDGSTIEFKSGRELIRGFG